MKHITDNDMMAYINGELSNEMNTKIEHHLHTCEECNQLAFFIQELTDEWNEPSVQPQQSIAHAVMKEIELNQQKQSSPKKRKRITYFHFCLAAAATILFSQLQIVEHIFHTSNEMIGFSSQVANQSLERGLHFLEIISNKITIGDEHK